MGNGNSVGVLVGVGVSVGVNVDDGTGVEEGVGVEVQDGVGDGVGSTRFRLIFLSAKESPSPCMYRRRVIGPLGIPLRSQV